MPLLTHDEWVQAGCPRLKVAFQSHLWATMYQSDPDRPATARLQTNVQWIGDPTDIRPSRYYKGEYALELARELGLFRAEPHAGTGKKSAAAKRTGKKKAATSDPFEDLHT